MDNATDDQFDSAQMDWFEDVLARDVADSEIATVVVGMHEALPDSISEDHSMSQSPTGIGKRSARLSGIIARGKEWPQTRLRAGQPFAFLHGEYFQHENTFITWRRVARMDYRNGRRGSLSAACQIEYGKRRAN